jgi:predicted RNA methylase
VGPHDLGRAYETSLDRDRRRRDGVHYTPQPVAEELVGLALEGRTLDSTESPVVCDPSCGGGAFLLAAADALVAAGRAPAEALTSLRGMDIDTGAVAVTRMALTTWAADHGVEPPSLNDAIVVGDALVDAWPEDGSIDVVVGNPPFGGQLGGSTVRDEDAIASAQRLLGRAAGYADTAGLFLVRALDAVRDDGSVVLVQPLSFLGARDAGAVRDRVLERARLDAMWLGDEHLFDASVHVCAPILHRAGASGTGGGDGPTGSIRVLSRDGVVMVERSRLAESGSWAPLAAAASGVPFLDPGDGPRLGSRADTTAGFRDEFYEVAECVHEIEDLAPAEDGSAHPRLVTVGLIDPARLLWGTRDTRLAGRVFRHPVIELAALAGRAASEIDLRTRPKVLVATQTRVIEAVVDVDGSLWPSVPVISVLPRRAGAAGLWLLAAAVMAPPAVAWMAQRAAGTARSPGALRISASLVEQIPLPLDRELWREGAKILRDGGPLIDAARILTRAHGLDDVQVDEVMAWWSGRLGRLGV